VAAGERFQRSSTVGDQNLVRWRCPLSHSTVTIVWPGPIRRAAFTAPTQFMADELPTKMPVAHVRREDKKEAICHERTPVGKTFSQAMRAFVAHEIRGHFHSLAVAPAERRVDLRGRKVGGEPVVDPNAFGNRVDLVLRRRGFTRAVGAACISVSGFARSSRPGRDAYPLTSAFALLHGVEHAVHDAAVQRRSGRIDQEHLDTRVALLEIAGHAGQRAARPCNANATVSRRPRASASCQEKPHAL